MTARLPAAVHALYKRTLSPLLHSVTATAGACRFQPTCSEYAVLAVAQGGWLAFTRVLRCNPLGRSGFDPVPGTWPLARGFAREEKTEPGRVGPRHLP